MLEETVNSRRLLRLPANSGRDYTHSTPRSEPLGLLRDLLLITVVARDTKGEGHALTGLESSLVSAVIEECTRAVTAEGYLPPT